MTAPGEAPPEDREGRIGPFPSWGWLYASVIIYTIALVILLYWFTVVLDHGGS